MKITWLGQAGLLFESGGYEIMLDPYLSDIVGERMGRHRREPVCEEFLKRQPDAVICTHNHLDHTDPNTLGILLAQEKLMQVLAPDGAWQEIRKFGGQHNYILFNRQTEVTLREGIRVKAIRAEHSAPYAIGVLIFAEGKTYYITGDTLYNNRIFPELPENIDVVFLPVNGEGNNMNMADAARFAEKTGAKTAVPVHWGMLDDINPKEFKCSAGVVIPEIYREIKL